MKSTKVKIPAKINFTLDICGVENGYHNLKSLVASINIFDTVIVKKRNDNKITLTEKGIKSGATTEKNNAYKSAKLYIDTFSLKDGVDIIIKKEIPVGGGLGGSSADICGTLKCLKKLFSFGDLTELANSLGSDCAYMLDGGFAVISGRGDNVDKLNYKGKKLYLNIIKDKKSMSSKDAFSYFDKMNLESQKLTEKAKNSLIKGNLVEFFNSIGNDLYLPVKDKLKCLEEKIYDLNKTNASCCSMTGSGSCVFAIYSSKKSRDIAYKLLKIKYKDDILKANTI